MIPSQTTKPNCSLLFNKFGLVPKVRLYQLSKPNTSFAFHTIKIGLAMFEISATNIIASHGISGRLAGCCLGSYLGYMN